VNVRCDVNISLSTPTYEGDLLMTNFKVIFKIKSEAKIQSRVINKRLSYHKFIQDYLSIPLSCINKIDKSNHDKKSSKQNYIEVYTKDFRYVKFLFDTYDNCNGAYQRMSMLAFPEGDHT
jgi:hypothetical protein